MLNEEKIRLMTGAAMYNKKAGKEILPVTQYFKSDYISGYMIRSFLVYTVIAAVAVAAWLVYQMEGIINTMDFSILYGAARYIIVCYCGGLLIYLLITYIVYAKRYDTASKYLKGYQNRLRRLEKKYHVQSGQEELEEGRKS